MATASKTKGKPVARKTATKTTKPAAKATKPAAKATKAAVAPASNGRRTHADMLKLVPEIVRKLKSGVTMTDIRGEYGPGPTIRRALMEKGYNTKGQRIQVEEITGTGRALAKAVATRRREGDAWYALELATGKTELELREVLHKYGYGDLAEGRVAKEPIYKPPAPVKPKAKTAPVKPSTARARTTKVTNKPSLKPTTRAKAKPAPAKAVRKPVRRRANP